MSQKALPTVVELKGHFEQNFSDQIRRMTREEFDLCWKALTSRQREILVPFLGGATYLEIAEQLGITDSAVRSTFLV